MHFFQRRSESDRRTVEEIICKELKPNPYQPRKIFEEEAITGIKGIY